MYAGERTVPSMNATVKLDSHIQKDEIRPVSTTLYKNWTQVHQITHFETLNTKMLEEIMGRSHHDAGRGKDFLNITLFVQKLKIFS